MAESHKTNLMDELKSLGLLDKKVRAAVDLLEEILYRLAFETLLNPSDLFTIRTVQESALVNKFLEEFRAFPTAVQNNAVALGEKGRLLFALGNFDEAAQDFAKAASRTGDKAKKGVAQFNQFQSLAHKGRFDQALPCYREAIQLDPAVCELFDSREYTPESILEVAVWGTGFLCRKQSGEHCVVKSLMDKSTVLDDLSRRLSLLRDIDSPYLVKVQEIKSVEVNHKPYVVMGAVNGVKLTKYLEESGEIPEDRAIPFIKRLAQGLSAAHARGIIHEDIRPGNILVVEQGQKLLPAICNFGLGIAREKLKEYQIAIGKKDSAKLSAPCRDILESCEYGAPERNNEPVEGKIYNLDCYSDVYAFGKVACQILFKTTKPYAQHWQQLTSEGFQEVLERCQVENPKNRYQNFTTVLLHLSAYRFAYEYYQAGEYAKALAYFHKAVDEDESSLASFALYLIYSGGDGGAVREGVAERFKMKALAYPGVEAEARRVAETGDSIAQTLMGYLYRFGKGVAQNNQEAAMWLQKAAENKNTAAQTFIGHICREGIGVPQNYSEAVRWYQKAADKGHAPAQYALGHMYRYGLGVPQEFAAAIRWYQKAAEKKCAAAQTNLGHIYCRGPAIARDYREAVQWVATETPQDYEQALAWYQKAAAQGHPVAQTNLGVMYLFGLGVAPDLAIAVKWFEKAAAKGYFPAQYAMGYIYRYGLGVRQDNHTAYQWVTRAAHQGDEDTQRVFQRLLKKNR